MQQLPKTELHYTIFLSFFKILAQLAGASRLHCLPTLNQLCVGARPHLPALRAFLSHGPALFCCSLHLPGIILGHLARSPSFPGAADVFTVICTAVTQVAVCTRAPIQPVPERTRQDKSSMSLSWFSTRTCRPLNLKTLSWYWCWIWTIFLHNAKMLINGKTCE